MSNKAMVSSIKKLVADLPEIYQPIFGHPKHSNAVSRQCHDRLEHIGKVYRALESQVQRPLRVLDLGCAQGFFSLSLAKLGATVHGVDYLDANIAVCNALARENPELNVSFQVSRIESILEQLQSKQYDLVLGLSVFHHIVHEVGCDAVQRMLEDLADKIAAGIFELALASEPLYWADAQPQEPWRLLSGFAFVHELAQHKTHLSDISRPLFFASNRYWCLNKQCGGFDSWQTDSHVLAQGTHQGTRRYYFGNGLIVKLFRLDHNDRSALNLQEHSNEVAFLLAPPPSFNSAQLVLQGRHKREAWLVRTQLPGKLLIDIIGSGDKYDSKLVLGDILAQLAALEAAGLYHSDVRTWNVLICSDGHAVLIDYGAIAKDSKDCVWPHDIFLGFLIFVHEVITGLVESPVPLRSVAISPYRLAHPYREWALSFWSRPFEQWSFKLLHELFMEIEPIEENSTFHTDDSLPRWMQAIEEAVDVQVATTRHLQWQQQQVQRSLERERDIAAMQVQMNQLQAHAQWLQNEWDAAKQQADFISNKAEQLEAKLESVNENNSQLQAHAQWLQNELDEANSKSQAHAQWLQKELDDVNSKSQAHAQWLQNELDSANSKINELNQLSHHWWVIADRLSQEQKSIYASKFWRITWPLRKIMQIAKWSMTLPVRTMKWFIRLPKHLGKPLIVWAMRRILNNSDMKNHALDTLARYPLIKQHLRLFAIRVGLINDEAASDEQINVEIVYSLDMEEKLINNLSPSAARIYAELLKRSIDARKN
jgi:O-antigen chain-terminating methyltransferase